MAEISMMRPSRTTASNGPKWLALKTRPEKELGSSAAKAVLGGWN